MTKRFFLFLIIFFLCHSLFSQDIKYARKLIDTLASPSMHGRGYVNNGDQIAAKFIENEFKNDSLKYFDKNYFQNFNLSVCTLPGKVIIETDAKKLVPGVDYLIGASSPQIKGTFKVAKLDSLIANNDNSFQKFISMDFSNKFILLDKKGIKDKKILAVINSIEFKNFLNAKGVINIEDKLIWGEDDLLTPSLVVKITIKRNSLPTKIKEVTVDIDQETQPSHEFSNIVGYIEGKTKPDSFIVFTAHYDHLGQMGKDIYFPGANDNASGTAMLLNLAKYYSKNKPDYSIVFISLTGEELGLIGSEYYVNNPLFPLSKIRFLVNLDMVGTGDDGIKVVNGSVYKKEFDLLTKINDKNKYLKTVAIRGEAANSDHYSFYKKGVKSIFIYTLGGIDAYHNIYDKSETLPLTKYNEVFKLLTDFVKALNP